MKAFAGDVNIAEHLSSQLFTLVELAITWNFNTKESRCSAVAILPAHIQEVNVRSLFSVDDPPMHVQQ